MGWTPHILEFQRLAVVTLHHIASQDHSPELCYSPCYATQTINIPTKLMTSASELSKAKYRAARLIIQLHSPHPHNIRSQRQVFTTRKIVSSQIRLASKVVGYTYQAHDF